MSSWSVLALLILQHVTYKCKFFFWKNATFPIQTVVADPSAPPYRVHRRTTFHFYFLLFNSVLLNKSIYRSGGNRSTTFFLFFFFTGIHPQQSPWLKTENPSIGLSAGPRSLFCPASIYNSLLINSTIYSQRRLVIIISWSGHTQKVLPH